MVSRPTTPEAAAARLAAPRPRRRVGSGAVLASLALHGAAFAVVAAVLAWRGALVAPPPQAALQVVWLDARPPPAPLDAAAPTEPSPPPTREADPPAAPAAEAAVEGLEPEDLLATMLPDTMVAPPPSPPPARLGDPLARSKPPPPPDPPAPRPTDAPDGAQVAPPPSTPSVAAGTAAPADRNAAFAALAVPPPPPLAPPAPPPARAAPPTDAPSPSAKRERQRAPDATGALARPVPTPGPPPRPEAAAAPAPPPIADRAPLVQGPPRFRRPPSPPDYPAQARDRGEEGVVGLRILVGADGATREVRVQRSSGNRLLDEAALAAARRWEIEPASVGGQRAEAWVEAPVRFRLDR